MPRHDPRTTRPRGTSVSVRVVFCEACAVRVAVYAYQVMTFHHTGKPRVAYACGKHVHEMYASALIEYALCLKGEVGG